MNNPEEIHPISHDREFFKLVSSLGSLGSKVVKDGFDPTPRPLPPELRGGPPQGHAAFMGDFTARRPDMDSEQNNGNS